MMLSSDYEIHSIRNCGGKHGVLCPVRWRLTDMSGVLLGLWLKLSQLLQILVVPSNFEDVFERFPLDNKTFFTSSHK